MLLQIPPDCNVMPNLWYLQCLDSLRTAVVKLSCLTNGQSTTAQHQHLLHLSTTTYSLVNITIPSQQQHYCHLSITTTHCQQHQHLLHLSTTTILPSSPVSNNKTLFTCHLQHYIVHLLTTTSTLACAIIIAMLFTKLVYSCLEM